MSTSTKQAPATAAATNTTPAAEADTHKSSEATDNSKSKQNQQQRPPYKRAYNNNNNNNNSNSEHPHRHPRQGPRPPYSGPPPAVVARITASDEFKEYRELAPSEVTDEEIMRAMRNFRNDPEKVKMHLISLYEKDTQGNKTTVGGFRGGRKPRDPNDDWKMVGKPKKNAPTKPGASRTQGKQKGASQSGKNAQKTSKSHQEEEEEDDDDEDEDEDSDDDSDAADNNVDKTKNAAAAWNGKALIEKVKKEKESAAKLSGQQNPPLPKKTAPAGPASSQQPSYAKASAPKPNEAHDQGSAKTPNEQGNQNNQQQAAAQPEVPSSSQTTAPVEQKPPAQPVVKAPAKPNYADILKGKKEKQPADKKPVKPATGSAKENQVADQSKSTPVDTAAITNQASNLSINDESSRTTSQQDSPAFAENASIEQSTSENAEASPVDLISNDNTSNAAEKAQIDEPVAIEEPVASEQIETIPHPIKQQVVVEPTPIENEKVVADNEIKSSIKDYPQHQVEQQTYIPPVQAQPQVQVPQPPQQVQQVPQQVQQVQQQVQPTQQQQIPQQQQQQGYGQYHQIPYQAQMHHDSPQGLDDAASGPNDDLQNNQGASQQHGGYDSNMAHLSGYGMQSQGQQGYGQGAYGGANNSVKRKATRGRGKTNTYDSVNAPYFQDGPSPYMYPNTTGYNDASNLYPPNYYQPGTMAHNAIPSTTVGMNQMQQPPNQYMQHTTSQMPGMGSQQHIPFQQQAQPDSQSYFGAIGNQAQVGVTSQDSVYRQQPVYAQPSQQGNTQNIPQQPTTHSHYGMTPAQQQQQQQNSPYPYGYYPYAYPAPAPHYPTFQQQPMGMGMGVNQMGSMAPAGVKSPPPGYVQNPTSIPPSVPSQAYGYPHATYMPQNWAQYYTNQQYGMQLSPAQQQQQGPLPGNGNEPAPYGQQSSTWRPNQ